jgi:two-component system, OmpR family, alkaline phosphatase synthesis response regulator PhoP
MMFGRSQSPVIPRKKYVLIAEPNLVLGNLIQFNLSRAGFTSILVHRGDEAFCRLGTNPFDFLITTLDLPGIPGIELCTRIRTDLKQMAIQFVLMVAKEETLDQDQLKSELNIAEIISKPFSIHDLTFLLEERSSSMFSPSRAYQQ